MKDIKVQEETLKTVLKRKYAVKSRSRIRLENGDMTIFL